MKKIFVIQTASIGDVILATALLESLHKAYPDASIDIMVKKGNEALFAGHPFLDNVIVWDKRSSKYAGLWQIIYHQIRQNKYDLAINIQRFFSTGMVIALSGARETRGFSKNPLSFLFTRRIKHQIGSGIHEVERNHALISDLTDSKYELPRLYPAPCDQAMVDQYISGQFYTISPASLWFTKQYPAEKWVGLLRQISYGAHVYLLGAPADQALCSEIITQAGHPGAINLAGKLTFLQSAALMRKARMNFTNDSAPMHLASSVNAPVTAVYCSTIPGFGFGPLSTDSAVVEISTPLPCRPCGLHGFIACPEKHFRCASGIENRQLVERL